MRLEPKSLRISPAEKAVDFHLSGDWVLHLSSQNVVDACRRFFANQESSNLVGKFYFSSSQKWDSSLLVFLLDMETKLNAKDMRADFSELPEKIQNLISFAKNRKAGQKPKLPSMSRQWDFWLFNLSNKFSQWSTFWGKWLLALGNFLIGRSFMRLSDLLSICRDCGASALPIVTLIAFLTGLTMAFVGSVQLEKFNATIYVADLVSLAMVREMGALMVAIVMAGRTGASYAAELGSMKIREEIDSLRTFGIPAMEFLVLPRTLALFIMTPILTLYADVIGILGGLTVGTQVMDFSTLHYFEQTQSALTNMWEVYSGLIKSLAFGLIIGLVGCYKGMFTGNNSASLGKSVTSSVVVSITLIVVCDAIFEIAFSYLGYR
ncbi:MAG: ABC transporter permease [Opitutae bacterium]